MDTLYLNPETWDLDVDANGNIAKATSSYAIVQDVASACRMWEGEAPFATDRGIPYADKILGQRPPALEMAGWYKTEAELVPGVDSVNVVLQYEQTRAVSGQVQLTLTDGTIVNV